MQTKGINAKPLFEEAAQNRKGFPPVVSSREAAVITISGQSKEANKTL